VPTSDQKGTITEFAVLRAAAELGIPVSKPLTDGLRYDLIFDLGGELVRVQCKTALRRDDVLQIACRSSRRCRDGFLHRSYSSSEVDGIAAYSAELGRCYYLPGPLVSDRAYVQLRLSPPRNNQAIGINWAKDFEFAATLPNRLGP
jgi:hypothetical protein